MCRNYSPSKMLEPYISIAARIERLGIAKPVAEQASDVKEGCYLCDLDGAYHLGPCRPYPRQAAVLEVPDA